MWITDKDGKILNEPIDFNNHAMDAGRYGMVYIKNPEQAGAHVHYPVSSQPRDNLSFGQRTPGAPVVLNQEKPKVAQTYIPRL